MGTPSAIHLAVRWPATFATVKQENSFAFLANPTGSRFLQTEFELQVRIPGAQFASCVPRRIPGFSQARSNHDPVTVIWDVPMGT